MFQELKQTVREFMDDDCPTLAAALAYYTVFSLPPLLFVVIVVAGFVVGRETVQSAIQQQMQSMIGGGTSGQVGAMVSGAGGQAQGGGGLGLVLSILALIFGATTAFVQLQTALDRSWKVRQESGGIGRFIGKRLLSFALVIGIAVLVLGSLVLSTWASSAGRLFGAPGWVIEVLSFAISFAVLFGLFAMIFKYLPDAEVEWSDVRLGALVTAGLFEAGKFLLSMYLGRAGTASMYGAAGSLALILLFVYYASMLVLLGAEFTQVHANMRGKTIRPADGYVRVAGATSSPPTEQRRGAAGRGPQA